MRIRDFPLGRDYRKSMLALTLTLASPTVYPKQQQTHHTASVKHTDHLNQTTVSLPLVFKHYTIHSVGLMIPYINLYNGYGTWIINANYCHYQIQTDTSKLPWLRSPNRSVGP